MMVVGISGKAETGKDYTAQLLRGAGFRPWSMAWHFKVWVVGQGLATYEEVFVTKPPHVRALLQRYGTEEGRAVYGEDIWCNVALAWITHLSAEWGVDRIVIPDIRFPNEVAMIHQMGGKVIRIEAPDRVLASRLSAEARQHVSETALDDYRGFDAVLANNRGADLLGQLIGATEKFGWKSVSQSLAIRHQFVTAA